MMTQETRHRVTLLIAWGGWIGAAALTGFAVFGVLARPYGVAVVFLIGAAIAAGMHLSRMRLAHTMTEVFRAGLSVAIDAAKHERKERHDA